MGPSCRPR